MPPRRGELGYREHQVQLLEAGRCGCEGCSGSLTDPARSPTGWSFCKVCGCASKVDLISGVRYACWVPAYGRCRVADVEMAELRRNRDQQARARLSAEEAGETGR
jgi:hypothetical protein